MKKFGRIGKIISFIIAPFIIMFFGVIIMSVIMVIFNIGSVQDFFWGIVKLAILIFGILLVGAFLLDVVNFFESWPKIDKIQSDVEEIKEKLEKLDKK